MLSVWYPVKAVAVFGLVALAALAGRRTVQPFPRFGPANLATLARAALTSLVIGLIGESRVPELAGAAVVMSVIAIVLDGVDGWLARRTGTASAFGARFDMEVDALLILGLSILVWIDGKAGVWVILSGLMRYLFVAAGWLLPWIGRPLPSSRRRQTICVLQIASLIVVLVPAVEQPISAWIAGLALATLAMSFLTDVLWLARQAGLKNASLDR